jgi:hypothetical protein
LRFFFVVGPLTLAGVAIASKIMNFELPGSSYARACALAAVPAVLVISLMAMGITGSVDRTIAMVIVLLLLPLSYLGTRFIFGIDWVSSIVAWIGAALLGLIGFVIAGLGRQRDGEGADHPRPPAAGGGRRARDATARAAPRRHRATCRPPCDGPRRR